MLTYEATISCNKEKCKTDNLTSDPYKLFLDAARDISTKAINDGWECESVSDEIYWCPQHLPNMQEAGK